MCGRRSKTLLRPSRPSATTADGDDCAWNASIGDQDFYGWTGIDRAVDSEYDSLRKIVELVGYELEG